MAACGQRMSRRSFLKRSAAGLGTVALSMGPLQHAFGQPAFPAQNMNVVIPTGAGGGAERIARVFSSVWEKYLDGVRFEYEFHPGAAGQVGYRLYTGRKPADGHHLLFGNMGPEMIGHTLEQPDYRFPEDFHYFIRVDVDDSVVFVPRDSRFQSIEQLVEEAQRRRVNVATSRIPHPASIGILALGEAVGADFNLVPYGGGRPTVTAVMGGEVECGVLPTGNPIQLKDQLKVVAVFSDENKLAPLMENPPSVNAVFGTRIPDLPSARAWAIHTSVREEFPDRYQHLVDTARQVFADPEFEASYRRTGAPWEAIQYGDADVCTRYVQSMVELTHRFRDLLTGAAG